MLRHLLLSVFVLASCGGGDISSQVDGDGPVSPPPPPPGEHWATDLGGASPALGIAANGDGTLTVAAFFTGEAKIGATTITSAGATDVLVVKLDAAGAPLWATSGGGTDSDDAYALAVDSHGNSYVTGLCTGSPTFGATTLNCEGLCDAFVAKVDSDGAFVWAVRAGGSGVDKGQDLAVVGDALYLVGSFEGSAAFGSTTLTSGGDWDGYVAKLDAGSGAFSWARSLGSSGAEAAHAVAADDSGLYVAGMVQSSITIDSHSLSSTGQTDAFVAHLTPDGQATWITGGGGAGSDYGQSLALNPAGGVYLGGSFENSATFGGSSFTGASLRQAVIASLDANGGFTWAIAGGDQGRQTASAIAVDSDGALLVAGYFEDVMTLGAETVTSIESSQDPYLARIDSGGAASWVLSAGGAGDDVANGVAIGPNRELTMVGYIAAEATFQGVTLTPKDAAYFESFIWRVLRP